jgi:sugar phosphate permease
MKYKYLIMQFAWLSFIINYLGRIGLATVLPLIRVELELTYDEAGTAMAMFFTGYCLTQLPSGFIADRFGGKKIIVVTIFSFSVITFFMGMIKTFIQLIFLCFLLGLAQGCHYAPIARILSNWFPERERARAMGIFSTSFAVGPALIPLMAASIVIKLSWRWVFYIFALTGFIFVPIWGLMVHDSSFKHKRSDRIRLTEIKEAISNLISTYETSDKKFLIAIFNDANVWTVSFAYFALLGIWWGFSSWLPSYLYEVRKLSMSNMGLFAGLPWILGCISMPLGGLISDKLLKGRRKTLIMICFVALAPCMYLISLVETTPLLTLLLSITGFFLQLPFGPFCAYSTELYPRLSGTVVGFQNMIGQLGSITMISLIGYAISRTNSYTLAFLSFGILASIGAALTFLMKNETLKG